MYSQLYAPVAFSRNSEMGLTSQNEDYLELVADGHMLRFPAVWLRDNCPCAECLDPVSGQKLKDITELPDGLTVSAEDTGESVTVTYAPGGHRSVFSRGWLAGGGGDRKRTRLNSR